jgi:hypothetical protein
MCYSSLMSDDPLAPVDVSHLNTTTYDDRLLECQAVFDRLVQVGIPAPPSSRFIEYRTMLRRFVDIGKRKDDPDLDLVALQPELAKLNLAVLHRGMLELEELALILDELPKQIPSTTWIPRVREIFAGTTTPAADTKRTPRDKQFELYIAALCIRAGFLVTLAEPDVVVDTGIAKFGIAAKRPSSSRRIIERLREAAKQIQRSGIDGIIAIDLSLVDNPDDSILLYEDHEHLLPPLQLHVENWVQSTIPHAFKGRTIPASAIGILVRMKLLARGVDPQLGRAARIQTSNLCSTHDPRFASLREFAIRLGRAIA